MVFFILQTLSIPLQVDCMLTLVYCRSTNVRRYRCWAKNMNINSMQIFLAVTVSYLLTPQISNINGRRNALICQKANIYSSEHKLIYSRYNLPVLLDPATSLNLTQIVMSFLKKITSKFKA